jgi:tetratricopeptide (TPR) repeat protein
MQDPHPGDLQALQPCGEPAGRVVGINDQVVEGQPRRHDLGEHHLAQLLLAQGEFETATEHLTRCLDLAERYQYLPNLRTAHRLLAERDLLLGNVPAARARLELLLDRSVLREESIAELLPILAWARLESGDLVNAAQAAKDAVREAAAEEHRLTLVEALRIQGMVLTRRGRWEEAEASLRDAMTHAATMPYPYAEARALYGYGRMQSRRGAPDLAGERLQEALAIFQRLGAKPYLERTEQALAALDQAP